MNKSDDTEFEEMRIKSVQREERSGFFSIEIEDAFWFTFPTTSGTVPTPGQTARFYGNGFGSPVRGLDIDGVEIFYKTPEEQQQEDQARSKEYERQQAEAEQKSRDGYAARLATDPLAFDWDRAGPSPEAAAALGRVQSEDEFPVTYSGQSWRYAYRLWKLTDVAPELLDGIGPFDDIPGEITHDLDLTGFMVGWGRNAVRQMRGKMPKPNGAVLTFGDVEQDPLPSRGSANDDLRKVLG